VRLFNVIEMAASLKKTTAPAHASNVVGDARLENSPR
jgi:hypothetical protein